MRVVLGGGRQRPLRLDIRQAAWTAVLQRKGGECLLCCPECCFALCLIVLQSVKHADLRLGDLCSPPHMHAQAEAQAHVLSLGNPSPPRAG